MNRDEFRQLYLDQRKRLVRLVYRWGATLDEADEVVQEAFEALWKKILNGDELESQIAFLLTVCRNKTLNLLTNSYRRNRLLGEDPSEDQDGNTQISYEGEFGDTRLREDCVRRKLHEFETDYPDAAYVVRMQLQGLPVLKIAAAISRTSEATRQYIYQSKKKMKPYLKDCKD
jgi:DNA-directed RNA polymerase specialized sigma24 family protein